MTRRSLLISTLAANLPLHLHAHDKSHPPRRTRRRPRFTSETAAPTRSSLNATSNDFDLSLLEISPLLPQSPSSGEIELSSRIINGDAASPNRYPYTASLVEGERHICGGTLIAPDVILTAGHCSTFFDGVHIDRYDVNDSGDYLMVEEHYPHPNYGNVIQSDFALAKLYGRSEKTVVGLNTAESTPVDDDYLTVMGWGVTVEGVSSSQSDVLREVEVQYMSNEECDASSGNYAGDFVTYGGYIEGNMMCAWSSNKDACQVRLCI